MSSTALLTSARPMPPHLASAPLPPDPPFTSVVVDDVQHPPVALAAALSPPVAAAPAPPPVPPPAPQSPRKRPRTLRPPPLVVPDPRPTSLPTSFYAQSSPRARRPRASPAPPLPHWPADPRSAAATRKGLRRRHNEDRVFAHPDAGVYGVCDGHGGTDVADQVAEAFPLLVAQGCPLNDAFGRVDDAVSSLVRKSSFMGTTLTAVQLCRSACLKVAHVGDSRAMIVDSQGRPTTLTRDHSPNRPDEQRRIEKAGGGVLHGRVNGVLAVSRAIGDTALKSVVSAVPETLDYKLSADDHLVVVATDGLWDLVADTEVVAYLRSRAITPGTAAVPVDLREAASGLVELAVSRGSKDDISVVLVDIRNSI